jgi:hypothetical protein
MREYQKINGIQKQCVTNCQFLYDHIKINYNVNVKVESVRVLSANNETLVAGHLVVIINDSLIIEPSYDVFILQNSIYFATIKDLMNNLNDDSKQIFGKKSISNFLDFKKIADRINNGGFVISDEIFYNNQADYISDYIKSFN